jgi:hypothetical protein
MGHVHDPGLGSAASAAIVCLAHCRLARWTASPWSRASRGWRSARPATAYCSSCATAAKGGRLRSVTMIVIFDVAGPLVAYSLLRSAGMTAVTALLLSGVFPAMGVTIGVIQVGESPAHSQ